MKTLLVAEYRDGKILASSSELINFAAQLGAESAMVLVGSETTLPHYQGKLYLADSTKIGEFNPSQHKQLILEVIEKEQPSMVVLPHSSYGWDLAPRIALALKAAQISEVVEIKDGHLVVPSCNAKLRRRVKATTNISVVTLQGGAFTPAEDPDGTPEVIKVEVAADGDIQFAGYEEAETGGVDLSKADIIVSAGRGIGKPENLAMIENLAKALKGEYGASRPVVDAEWADPSRQVGTTGQTVTPKLYVACGISGAIQHLAGMKKSEFVLAINTDKDAPIGEIADVLAVADLKQLVPILTEKLNAL
ncbi:electron transfer flavoprotein alpha subunit apoprotein [Desulfuromusa kysingii]|uniref:Electron transfer flavoprotein alpha subunit apoprotein n=1 Tax=Desulfuromusa kysingii TaxID=37625 RepID=A0A1H3VII6_9BACT|nr:electron transfer flavoprotein subunit alpha/FixB family protein [Desulfuromusa kysingii]SDZ74586.1 electron transfer flavoprotein alpha subunit apoprotein [Desulfuromusa kysingii]